VALQEHLSFSYFFNAFSFGAENEDLFFVTHGIISLLPMVQTHLYQG